MDDSAISRSIQGNWSKEERMELLEILRPHIHVIDNKGSDTD